MAEMLVVMMVIRETLTQYKSYHFELGVEELYSLKVLLPSTALHDSRLLPWRSITTYITLCTRTSRVQD